MAFKGAKQDAALAVLALFSSAVLFWFGTGLHPLWWLTWWAPLPVLLFAARSRFSATFAIAFAGWMLGAFNEWSYARDLIGMPWPNSILMCTAPAFIFALCVLLWRSFDRRGHIAMAACAFASAWTGFEFALQTLSPNSTFGSVAYTQMNNLPILQTASVTGFLGITFLVFLFPATLDDFLAKPGSQSEKRFFAIAVLTLLASTVGWGYWRLRSTPASVPKVQVGLVTSDLPTKSFS